MKTLKYLMLLLAVALALPAMAQEKAIEATGEKVAVVNKDTETKDVSKEIANVTTGRLNKADYAVQVLSDGTLLASVRMDQGMILTLVKRLDGSVRKICEGKGKKGACPNGFTYEEVIVDEMTEKFAADEEERAWER